MTEQTDRELQGDGVVVTQVDADKALVFEAASVLEDAGFLGDAEKLRAAAIRLATRPTAAPDAGEAIGWQVKLGGGRWSRVLYPRDEADEALRNPRSTVTDMRPVYAAALTDRSATDAGLRGYEKFDGAGPHSETIETRARIGESYLDAYDSALSDPLLAGYMPADCPSELLLDLLERLRVALTTAPACVPNGMTLVPIEPTEVMWLAWNRARQEGGGILRAWSAMLEAALAQPTTEPTRS